MKIVPPCSIVNNLLAAGDAMQYPARYLLNVGLMQRCENGFWAFRVVP